MNKLRCVLSVIVVFTLTACGGGGGGDVAPPAARTVTLKLATTGTPSAPLAGVGVTVTLPHGVTPLLDTSGHLVAGEVTVTGVASPGMPLAPEYTPASGTTNATLRLAMASGIADGFGAGEFLTVTLALADGVVPVQADFPLTSFYPVDVAGNTVTGLTLTASVAMP